MGITMDDFKVNYPGVGIGAKLREKEWRRNEVIATKKTNNRRWGMTMNVDALVSYDLKTWEVKLIGRKIC
jgi:hypothetical protein